MAFILLVYLSSFGVESGMTTITTKFNSEDTCLAAKIKVEKEFGGIATRIRAICVKE